MSQLGEIEHIVVVMLENRSFDQMLGFLYAGSGNRSPSGQQFDGLTGTESNLDQQGTPVTVFEIDVTQSPGYYTPGLDPGEGYTATNNQLFGSMTAPTPPIAKNNGFVADFEYWLSHADSQYPPVAGTTEKSIMGVFTPTDLPVLSGLARGYAVCDQWFASAPTETIPNRAFTLCGTSHGHMDDKTTVYDDPTIFGLLSKHDLDWRVYGYDTEILTKTTYTEITDADASHFGFFTDFQAAAAAGSLPPFTFLEPSWSYLGNSQHPNYDVAPGETFIFDVYQALRNGPGWNQTLLIVTYDEHGGCYDHVPPPQGAVPPDGNAGEFGFDFTRFGVRVPAVLVSPWIPAGTVFRVPPGTMPIDHTAILKTVEERWEILPTTLTARDQAAPSLGAVLTASAPRTDDPLAGVTPPVSPVTHTLVAAPTHIETVMADQKMRLATRHASGALHEPPTTT
jgi:phospholipase C